jgi:16S rRNA U516 pseudouridylate synthase RsuA-like enzyme
MAEYTEAKQNAENEAKASDAARDKDVKSKSSEEQAVMLKKKKGEITQEEMDEKMAKIAEMMKKKGQ